MPWWSGALFDDPRQQLIQLYERTFDSTIKEQFNPEIKMGTYEKTIAG